MEKHICKKCNKERVPMTAYKGWVYWECPECKMSVGYPSTYKQEDKD